jgi:hypothetical protein
MLNIKIGEASRPSTFKVKQPLPQATTMEESWVIKSQVPQHVWQTPLTTANNATDTAKAWLKHPANKMQLKSLRDEHDTDGDGVTNREEFKSLLRAAGSTADANLLFDKMDRDGDGILTEDEIKALGQDRMGLAGRRGMS